MVGLAAGLACTLLIFLWVQNELAYDHFFANNDQLFQLMERQTDDGKTGISDGSSGLLADAVKAKFPEVEYAAPLAAIQQLYKKENPGFDFSYSFLDGAYQRQYINETKVSVLSKYFAGLAILISCLGLFGLAAFTAPKRRKEIGIRKVIGASVSSITALLSKDFLQLVGLSLLIAFPVSWWLMEQWLQSFAYRITVTPFVFLLAGGSVIFITIITIGFQSVKAATLNPVESLRSE